MSSSTASVTSSTRSRVTPARQPDESGGREQAAADADEHVGAGALAEQVGGGGEDRLGAAPLLGVGEGLHVLGVGGRLDARHGAALVARPRHHAHGGRRLGVLERRRPRRPRWRRPRRAPSRAGPTPPVTVMRTRASGRSWDASTSAIAARSASSSYGQPQVEAVGRAAEALEVAADGEGPAVDRLERLEDAVADGEAVVEDRDGRVGARPRATRSATPCSAMRPILTRRGGGWRALSSVSAHSSSGSLSHVMPPPVPRWSWPSSTQNVRMATLRSPCRRSASTQPTAPQ